MPAATPARPPRAVSRPRRTRRPAYRPSGAGRADPAAVAELVARYRAGDRGAGDRLLVALGGVVVSAMARLGRLPGNADPDDLLQAGRMAVLYSATKWEPDHTPRTKFTTYASRLIRLKMLTELRRVTDLRYATETDIAELDCYARDGFTLDDLPCRRAAG